MAYLFYHAFSLLPYVVNYERCCSFPLISFYLAGSMYQYFVKIVPTIYRKLNGEVSAVPKDPSHFLIAFNRGTQGRFPKNTMTALVRPSRVRLHL